MMVLYFLYVLWILSYDTVMCVEKIFETSHISARDNTGSGRLPFTDDYATVKKVEGLSH